MLHTTDAVTEHGNAGAEPPGRWFALDVDRVVTAMRSDAERGLGDAEAAMRLSRHGPNQIAGEKPPSVWAVALRQLRDPRQSDGISRVKHQNIAEVVFGAGNVVRNGSRNTPKRMCGNAIRIEAQRLIERGECSRDIFFPAIWKAGK